MKSSGKTGKNTPSKKSSPRTWQWNHLHLIGMVLGAAFVLSFFIGVLLYLFVSLDIPKIDSLASYQPYETSIILDDRGKVIASFYRQNRRVVSLARMPELLPRAFVAAEDARFFEHSGVDGWSIIRALLHNIKAGSRAQGGSTITQQVARSLLLSPEKTYSRKIREAILAYRIDKVLTKEDVLHIYLNQIYLGEGAYGVEAASRTYFDKSAAELNLAEISLLAGLPQAPSRYSPFKNYKKAKGRQMYVLNRMAEDGYISPTAARRAYKKSLLWASEDAFEEYNGYFVQHVRQYIENKYGSDKLYTGGLVIRTTLNQKLQKEASEAVGNGVVDWQKRNPSRSSLKPQGALVAIDVPTGKVKALVGGTDYSTSQFDRATQARRQPGSAFKPLIYAAAFANGFTPASIIMDEPIQFQGAKPGEVWEPQNFSGFNYGPTPLRDGLVFSRNIVTIKLLQEVGVTGVVRLARDAGIQAQLGHNLSLALGVSGLSLLELTSAYTIFPSQGKFRQPLLIKKITNANGVTLEKNMPGEKEVLDACTAFQVTEMLQQVIDEGTGRRARGLSIPAAGKTGTSDSNMDAWFMGFTPTMATGVWVGFDQNISLGVRETGGRLAAPIWKDFMQEATSYRQAGQARKSPPAFGRPDNMIYLQIDRKTGKIASDTSDQTDILTLPFCEGNIPENLHPADEDFKLREAAPSDPSENENARDNHSPGVLDTLFEVLGGPDE